MKKRIVIVDGMGGGIGSQVIEGLRSMLGDAVEILALGTNSGATERMLKAGADRGASGENAIRVSVGTGCLVIGPIGIVIPNGMLGEITEVMAQAVLASPGERILIPVAQEHFLLAGFEAKPLGKLVEDTMVLVKARLDRV